MKKTPIEPIAAGMEIAVELLGKGLPVAVPTETVYGLAGDATNGSAIAAIYEAKGRPSFNPLIIHVSSFEMAEQIGEFNADMTLLAHTFWPGPLTLVVPIRERSNIHPLSLAGLDTVALRIPLGALCALSAALQKPLAAPSANRSGQLSPTNAMAVKKSLNGKIDLILDGGPTPIGIESTIIGQIGGMLTLLRPGGVPAETIEKLLGRRLNRLQSASILAPGMMASHYAPNAMVRLNATKVHRNESFLGFGPDRYEGTPDAHLNLSETGNLSEAAQNLFSHLRALDNHNPKCIAVAPIPNHGLGEAINDRLQRAAAPRDS